MVFSRCALRSHACEKRAGPPGRLQGATRVSHLRSRARPTPDRALHMKSGTGDSSRRTRAGESQPGSLPMAARRARLAGASEAIAEPAEENRFGVKCGSYHKKRNPVDQLPMRGNGCQTPIWQPLFTPNQREVFSSGGRPSEQCGIWNVELGIPAAAEDHDGRQAEGEERPGRGLGDGGQGQVAIGVVECPGPGSTDKVDRRKPSRFRTEPGE